MKHFILASFVLVCMLVIAAATTSLAQESEADMTDEPGVSDDRGITDEPGAPEESGTIDEPGAAGEPDVTDESGITEEPGAAEEPGVGEEPEMLEEPGAAEERGMTEEPGAADQPPLSEGPGVSGESDMAEQPDVSYAEDFITKEQEGNIKYASGGVGLAERDAMLSAADNYNLLLSFADDSGKYLAGIPVEIRGPDDLVILDATSNGPWFMVDLPPGRYTVSAEYEGMSKTAEADVTEGSLQRILLTWEGGEEPIGERTPPGADMPERTTPRQDTDIPE